MTSNQQMNFHGTDIVEYACGNCFVLKPSEKTPTASLLADDRVNAVSFVGSTPFAEYV